MPVLQYYFNFFGSTLLNNILLSLSSFPIPLYLIGWETTANALNDNFRVYRPLTIYINVLYGYQTYIVTPNRQKGQSRQKKIFGGVWTDKKTTRHLQISFENDQYATITDWTSKYQKRESGDVYKAFVENGKLIMPEDTEHHASYSEITAENNILIYRTKVVGNGIASSWDKQVFTRK